MLGQPADDPTRVLVVDDDPFARCLLVELLRQEGCQVGVALDVRAAWERLLGPGPVLDAVLIEAALGRSAARGG